MFASVRRKAGFTMIELLVVIGIITLLVAIMGTVLAKLKERTKMGQARTIVEKCYSAIEQYHMTFRAYPPATTTSGLNGVQALHYYITTTFNPIPGAGEKWADTYCASCTTFQPHEFRKNGAGYDIIDPFNTALVYRVDVQTDQNGAQTFMPVVYSGGVNKIDDGGLLNTDDIVIGK